MKKLASILLAVSSLSVTAHADFYAGLKIGPSVNTGEFSTSNAAANPSELSSLSVKNGAGVAALGGLFLGYDMVTSSNLYVAGEANLLLSSLKNKLLILESNGAEDLSSKLENNFLYGLDLQLGYKLSNDVIPFVSLGFLAGKYKLSATNSSNAPLSGIAAGDGFEYSKNTVSFNPGIGVKYVYDQLVVTTQYQYLMGDKLSTSSSDGATPLVTWNYSNKLRQHYFSLGLAYAM